MAPHIRPPEPSVEDERNIGVYRMQVLGRDRAIIRWLAHRGGARHHEQWLRLGRDMPVAVVIGADPATILSNKLPPETEREWGSVLAMDPAVSAPIDALWPDLGLACAPGAAS